MIDFQIDFVSECDHEHLSVEISYKNQRLCVINKEQGNARMEIEFLTDLFLLPQTVIMKFPLSDFEEVINEAKDALATCP
jgi:hypothetical protein